MVSCVMTTDKFKELCYLQSVGKLKYRKQINMCDIPVDIVQ